MKKITFVKLTYCPFCRKAEMLLQRLLKENEDYCDLEIERIAEDLDPEKAAGYPYELVPNFWLDGEKVLEGIPYILTLRDVLEGALKHEEASAVRDRVEARGFPKAPPPDMPPFRD